MKTKKASKTNITRLIFFTIELTYNLILGFYLRHFLVLSPTLLLTVKTNSKEIKATVYILLILTACMNIAYSIYCRRVFPILAIISLGIVFMYFVAFVNATRKDKLLTKIIVLLLSATILLLLFSAYIYVYKQDNLSLTNGYVTL